ncbi:MAG: hypothetical protein FWF49_05305 [Oscillospiraceae bacterium]|nr:hypothetical protein [Oscillospiraceae bacterium]
MKKFFAALSLVALLAAWGGMTATAATYPHTLTKDDLNWSWNSDPTAMKGWVFNSTDPLSMTANSDTNATSWDRWYYKDPLPRQFTLSWDLTFVSDWNTQTAFSIRIPSNPEIKVFMREQYQLDDSGNAQSYIAAQVYINGGWNDLLPGAWYPMDTDTLHTYISRAAGDAKMHLIILDGNGMLVVESDLQNSGMTNDNFFDATVTTDQGLWAGLEYSMEAEGADQDFTLSNIVVKDTVDMPTPSTTAAPTLPSVSIASTAASTAATTTTHNDDNKILGLPLWAAIVIGAAIVVVVAGVIVFVVVKGKKKKA